MKRAWTNLPVITFFIAVGLVFAGQQFEAARLTAAGFLFLGITAVVAGIEVILTRQASFLPSGYPVGRRIAEHYSGLAAQLWGLFFVLAGLGSSLAALAAIVDPVRTQTFLDQFFEGPTGWGILLLTLGVFLGIYGAIRLLAGRAAAWSTRRLLVDLGYRGLGAVCLLAALGLVGLGLVLVVNPGLILSTIEQWIPSTP